MQKISPYLWFNDNAEEAIQFYTSVFKNARMKNILRFNETGPDPQGKFVSCTFELEGQEFIAINGGPRVAFTEAISLYVHCESQQEVDHLWEKLSEGGEKQKCGWLKDQFGVSWQIIPTVLDEMLLDPDPEKVRRVTRALLKMDKIDIETLEGAYAGKHE